MNICSEICMDVLQCNLNRYSITINSFYPETNVNLSFNMMNWQHSQIRPQKTSCTQNTLEKTANQKPSLCELFAQCLGKFTLYKTFFQSYNITFLNTNSMSQSFSNKQMNFLG